MNKKILGIIVLVVVIVIAVIVGIFFKTKSESNNNVPNSNTTTPYIPERTNVADENDTRIPADTLKYNRNKENVTIEVLQNTITKEKVEILITDNNEYHYGWGVEFRVQEKVNGEWEELNYVSSDQIWNSLAYLPNENNQITQKLDIEKYYGKLFNGVYRIVKPVYDNDDYIDIYSNEFEIK